MNTESLDLEMFVNPLNSYDFLSEDFSPVKTDQNKTTFKLLSTSQLYQKKLEKSSFKSALSSSLAGES